MCDVCVCTYRSVMQAGRHASSSSSISAQSISKTHDIPTLLSHTNTSTHTHVFLFRWPSPTPRAAGASRPSWRRSGDATRWPHPCSPLLLRSLWGCDEVSWWGKKRFFVGGGKESAFLCVGGGVEGGKALFCCCCWGWGGGAVNRRFFPLFLTGRGPLLLLLLLGGKEGEREVGWGKGKKKARHGSIQKFKEGKGKKEKKKRQCMYPSIQSIEPTTSPPKSS